MKNSILLSIILVAILACGLFFISKNNLGGSKKEISLKESQEKEAQKEDLTNNDPQDIENIRDNEDVEKEKKTADQNEEGKPEVEEEKEKPFQAGIIDKKASWGYQKSSGRSIDTVIIHSSYNAMGGDQYSVEKLIEEYREYGVSPHYLIDRSGTIYRLVEDKNIAYHAGESKAPDGRKNVNGFSIGIEVMNTKSDKCTANQYSALKSLIAGLKSRYVIKYVLGHSDIAKGRKDDPWNLEWNRIK